MKTAMPRDEESAQTGAARRSAARRSRVMGGMGLAIAAAFLWVWGLPLGNALIGDNLHLVIPGQVWRSGQLSGAALERVIQRHAIRSVINLRGSRPGDAWYDSERAVVERLDVVHHDLGLSADRQPHRDDVVQLIDLLETTPRPVLVHCDAGADRAGFASVIARILNAEPDLAESRRELSLSFGHIPFGPSDALDRVLDRYERYLHQSDRQHGPSTFKHWAATEYVPYSFKGAIEAVQFPERSNAEAGFEARFQVRNLSPEIWWPWSDGESGVRLGFRLRRDGDTQSHEYPHRFDLTGAVAPGETASMTGYITAPTEPGVYVIKVDLVAEGVTWFEAQGSRPIELRLEVEPAG